ncbi:hypothetical protein BDW71DRAFT_177254 [Aspergillus fruticulosus]
MRLTVLSVRWKESVSEDMVEYLDLRTDWPESAEERHRTGQGLDKNKARVANRRRTQG